MTKQVWAVYGTEPGRLVPPDYPAVQAPIDRVPGRFVVSTPAREATARVGCYSVTHDRSEAPVTALVVADLEGGARAYARRNHPDALAAFGDGEWVGRRVCLRPVLAGSNEVVI